MDRANRSPRFQTMPQGQIALGACVWLADRLRAASRDERSRLYAEIYSELFNSLPDHPQKAAVGSRPNRIAKQVRFLKPLMGRSGVYLEIGCGDASLPIALSGAVRSRRTRTGGLLQPELKPRIFAKVSFRSAA
jgi:hypothetical protein